jgi:hypothetical protein
MCQFLYILKLLTCIKMKMINKYTQNIHNNGLLKGKYQLGSKIYISIQVDLFVIISSKDVL